MVLAGQPKNQGSCVPAGGWPAGLTMHGPGGPAAAAEIVHGDLPVLLYAQGIASAEWAEA